MARQPPETFASSEALCEAVLARYGRKVLLSFSNGKDSVATWLQLHRHGFEVYPYFRYMVPGLRFIERSLTYYEQFFGRAILRVPDPALLGLLDGGTLQPIHRVIALDNASLNMRDERWDTARVEKAVRRRLGFDDQALAAAGWRASDSFRRRLVMMKYGVLRPKKPAQRFYPVYDWTEKRLVAELRAAKLALPPDYRVMPRSFELKFQFIEAVRVTWPDDYQRMLAWFPLMGVDLARRRFYEDEGLEVEAAAAKAAALEAAKAAGTGRRPRRR